MSPKVSDADKSLPGSNQNNWLTWCRLCAKREDNDRENLSIFVKNESGIPKSQLIASIAKYFWVNIKTKDTISKRLCYECRKLVEELIRFTERVTKVQNMYALLEKSDSSSSDHANKLRFHCGLNDEGWEHFVRPEKQKEIEKFKSLLNYEESPKDLIVSSNYGEGENHLSSKSAANDENIRQEIMEDLNNQQIESQELISTEKIKAEPNYEYILQDEIEIMDTHKQDIKSEEQEQISELKLKTEDEEDTKSEYSSEQEENELEYSELKLKTEDKEGQKLEYSSGQEDNELEDSEYNSSTQDTDDKEDDSLDEEEESIDFSDSTKRKRPSLTTKKSCKNINYECKDCKRKYKNPNNYRKHMQIKHNTKIENIPDFVCSICKKDCIFESRLKTHMRQHLPDEEKSTIPCPYCDRKFTQIGSMKQHIDGIHHQLKPFQCDQCDRSCKTMSALVEHRLVHTDECPFVCKLCDKRFKSKSRLKSHMEVHTESSYGCPDCGLTLNSRRTLLQHCKLVHSDVKNFKCEFCDAAFKRLKSLKDHLPLHTGVKPYKCNFCDKAFTYRPNCWSHKKRCHASELAEERANGTAVKLETLPNVENSAEGDFI